MRFWFGIRKFDSWEGIGLVGDSFPTVGSMVEPRSDISSVIAVLLLPAISFPAYPFQILKSHEHENFENEVA